MQKPVEGLKSGMKSGGGFQPSAILQIQIAVDDPDYTGEVGEELQPNQLAEPHLEPGIPQGSVPKG